MQPRQDDLGRTIDGRYVVESVLGKGGMGVVLKVRHKYTGQHAALKLLHPHLRMQGDLAQRFLAEARAPAAIGHPGIVTVVDAGFTPEGELFLVMELLRGLTLAEAMKPQPMPFAAIRRIGLEILAALGAAHAAGFIHRDLKPENVFLADPTGTVKLLDFGIAKVLDEGLGARGETQAGMVMGTVAYMSPEQLRDSKNVDARTDLWAAGVMIYEMATGRLPYPVESLGSLLVAMMAQPPRPLAEALTEVPPPLELFLRRALAVDVHQRFASAAEMAAVVNSMHVQALQRRGQAPVVAKAPAPPPRAAPQPTPAAPYVPPAAAPAPPYVPPAASVATPPSAMVVTSAPAAHPTPPAPRSRAALYVAGGALLAALGLAVALVLVLRARQAAPPTAASVSADAAPAPLAAPAAPPDAVPAPPDAAPAPAPHVTPPPAPAPRASKRELCKAACTTSQKKCGVVYVGPCLETCLDYPDEAIDCLAAAGDRCDLIGACAFHALCGAPPTGNASCSTTAACVLGCGNDLACTCRCARAMSVGKTNLFLRFASCAIARCAESCEVSANVCLTCVRASCASSATACMAQ